jgi:hypothetical protein
MLTASINHRPDDGSSISEMSVNFYQTTRRNIPKVVFFILAAVNI